MRQVLIRRAVIAAAAILIATVLQAQTTPAPSEPAPEWKSYSYAADGFSATYPGEPQLQKNDVPTDVGNVQLRVYLVTVGTSALFVGVCDYGSAAAGKIAETLLQRAKDGSLANSSSHLVSEKKISLGVYQGLEYEAESDAAHFSARIYIVGTTLYQTLVVTPLGAPFAGATRFLDSFQLIPRVQNY